MDNIFVLNENIDEIDIKDATQERIAKIKSLIIFLLSSNDHYLEPKKEDFNNILSVILDLLEEIILLCPPTIN